MNSVVCVTILYVSYQSVIPAKAGIQFRNPGFRIKSGMTTKAKGLLIPYPGITFCFLIILSLSFLTGCDRPKITGIDPDEIDTFQDPIQMPYQGDEPIIRDVKNGHFMITPVAQYKISGMVVGKATYSSDWDGKVSPVDLAIAWGKLAERGSNRYITYTRGYRWYFYQCKPGSAFDHSYIISHSSNNHIIPANENIRKAVNAVKKKDKVVLEGFLVNVRGIYKERPVAWNTSLSRTDAGIGSCELFYVLKVRIEKKVYE